MGTEFPMKLQCLFWIKLRLKHPGQQLKGLMALLTAHIHLSTVRGKCSNLWRTQQGEHGRAACHTIKEGTSIALKEDQHPFGLPLTHPKILESVDTAPSQTERKGTSSWANFFVEVFFYPHREGHFFSYYTLLGTLLLAILHTMEILISCQEVGFLEKLPIFNSTTKSLEEKGW